MDFVYKTTNLVNGKEYVGSHTTKNENDNYLGSGLLILKARKKYGKENFKREILEICENRKKAVLLEEVYIKKYNNLIPNGYNISLYGNAAFPGEKNPMYGKIPWNKGKKMSKEFRKKMSEILKGNSRHLGHTHSDEAKEKISKAHKGHKRWVGKTHSEETKKKMSESHKGQIAWNKGKKASPETREKMRQSRLGKPSPNKGKKYFINENGKKRIQQ